MDMTPSKSVGPPLDMKRSIALVWLMTLQFCGGATPELFQQRDFTAATFAEAINSFVRLGENAAVQELRGLALDDTKDRGEWSVNERIGWMCRVLFDPKDSLPIRQPLFGALSLPYHTMPLSSWPRYPVALSGSTYFVLSEGYELSGLPEDSRDYIEHCRIHGVFRKTSIAVPTRAQALLDAAALRKSKAWTDIKWTDKDESWSYPMAEACAWEFIQKQANGIP